MYTDLSHLPDPELRTTAAQRIFAVSVLKDAAADGRITFEEMQIRMPDVINATARADLYGTLADLLSAAELAKMVEPPLDVRKGRGLLWQSPWIFRTNLRNYRLCAPWDVPPFLELVGGTLAFFYLNFDKTTPLTPVIDLTITGTGGVSVVVPEGWGVDVQQLNLQTGDVGDVVSSKVPSRAEEGQHQLVINGASTGDVKVRHPNRWDTWRRRRYARQLAKGSITR